MNLDAAHMILPIDTRNELEKFVINTENRPRNRKENETKNKINTERCKRKRSPYETNSKQKGLDANTVNVFVSYRKVRCHTGFVD